VPHELFDWYAYVSTDTRYLTFAWIGMRPMLVYDQPIWPVMTGGRIVADASS
jgi:hypothetical protein